MGLLNTLPLQLTVTTLYQSTHLPLQYTDTSSFIKLEPTTKTKDCHY